MWRWRKIVKWDSLPCLTRSYKNWYFISYLLISDGVIHFFSAMNDVKWRWPMVSISTYCASVERAWVNQHCWIRYLTANSSGRRRMNTAKMTWQSSVTHTIWRSPRWNSNWCCRKRWGTGTNSTRKNVTNLLSITLKPSLKPTWKRN